MEASAEWNLRSTSSTLGPYIALIGCCTIIGIYVKMKNKNKSTESVNHKNFFKDIM